MTLMPMTPRRPCRCLLDNVHGVMELAAGGCPRFNGSDATTFMEQRRLLASQPFENFKPQTAHTSPVILDARQRQGLVEAAVKRGPCDYRSYILRCT